MLRKTNLLRCGVCEKLGTTQVLGEIAEDGALLVQRFHRGFTKILGGTMVVCGACGNEVYKNERREDGTVLSYRIAWAHWQTANEPTQQAGTYLPAAGTE